MEEQLNLDMLFGKMSPELSPATRAKTSGLSLKNSAKSQKKPLLYLSLQKGSGQLLEPSWEMVGVWHGESWTPSTGESPNAAVASSLSQILEANPPRKYFLSEKACAGILRRAEKRGKELPPMLKDALLRQCSSDADAPGGGKGPLIQDDLSATLSCANVQTLFQPVVSAGFRNGNSAQSRSVGLEMELSPTIPAEAGGNKACVVTNQPCVLPFNTTQITSPTNGNNPKWGDPCHCLASTDHPPAVIINNQPCVLDMTHANDVIRECGELVPTLQSQMGTGGNQVPLVMRESGKGYWMSDTVAGTLQCPNGGGQIERSAVIAEPVCLDCRNFVANEISANCNHEQPILARYYAVRRLTPLECTRLQGFPDGWMDIPGASDSAKYKAAGNSVAIPCVEYVMAGIAEVINDKTELLEVTAWTSSASISRREPSPGALISFGMRHIL